MKFNKLIPELSVSDFKKSLNFYTNILGFKIEYQRGESNFAYLSFQGSQIMIDQGNNDKKSPWFTGILKYPRGKGVHFQFEVKDTLAILNRLKKYKYPIKENPKEYWFRKGNYLIGVKGFLIMDPYGYLLMFNEDIGTKKISKIKPKNL